MRFKIDHIITYSDFTPQDYEVIVNIGMKSDTVCYMISNNGNEYTHPCRFVDSSDDLVTDIFVM